MTPWTPPPSPRCRTCSGWALRSSDQCGTCIKMFRAAEKRRHHERVVAAVEALHEGQGVELPVAGRVRKCEFLHGKWLTLDAPMIVLRYWTVAGETREREVRAEILLEHGYAVPTSEDKLFEEMAKLLPLTEADLAAFERVIHPKETG